MEKRVHKLTFYHPVVEKIAVCFEKAYLVGGFVRDRLLRILKESVDIDITTPDDLSKVKNCVSRTLNLSSFTFEKEKTVVTFIGDDFRIDISNLYGETLEEDLLKRDFTINAIAVDISELFLPFNDDVLLIDPSGGFEDLQKGLIRPVTATSITDDPVRIVRGVRLKVLLDFEYHSSFLEQSRANSEKLKESAVERIKEELIKILKINRSAEAFRDLDYLDAFVHIFPELSDLEKIPPSGLHQYNLKEHTFRTVEFLENYCLEKKEEILLEFSEEIGKQEFLPGFFDSHCLKLVALYHDVGKPLTVKEKDGKLTFYSHDKVGAEIAKKAFIRLGFGKKAVNFGFKVIRHHLRPFFLYNLFKKEQLSDRAIYRFFRDTEPYSFHTLFHSVADWMATSTEMENGVDEFIDFIHFLLRFYRERLKDLKPLLSGKEIMEIKGFDKPNKCVGIIKKKMLELQAIGRIETREDAINFVRGYSCENPDKGRLDCNS